MNTTSAGSLQPTDSQRCAGSCYISSDPMVAEKDLMVLKSLIQY